MVDLLEMTMVEAMVENLAVMKALNWVDKLVVQKVVHWVESLVD